MNQLILLNEDGNPLAIINRKHGTKESVYESLLLAINENYDLHEEPNIPDKKNIVETIMVDSFHLRFLIETTDHSEFLTLATAWEY